MDFFLNQTPLSTLRSLSDKLILDTVLFVCILTSSGMVLLVSQVKEFVKNVSHYNYIVKFLCTLFVI